MIITQTHHYSALFFVCTAINLLTNLFCGWFAIPDIIDGKDWVILAVILIFELIQTFHIVLCIYCYFERAVIKTFKMYYIIESCITAAITLPSSGYVVFLMLRMKCHNDPYCMLFEVLMSFVLLIIFGIGATNLGMCYCLYQMRLTKQRMVAPSKDESMKCLANIK